MQRKIFPIFHHCPHLVCLLPRLLHFCVDQELEQTFYYNLYRSLQVKIISSQAPRQRDKIQRIAEKSSRSDLLILRDLGGLMPRLVFSTVLSQIEKRLYSMNDQGGGADKASDPGDQAAVQ